MTVNLLETSQGLLYYFNLMLLKQTSRQEHEGTSIS